MTIDRKYLRELHGMILPAEHLLTEKMRWDLYRVYPKAFSEPPPEPQRPWPHCPIVDTRRQEPTAKASALTPDEIEKIVNKRVVEKMLAEHGNEPETHRALEAAGLEVGPAADPLEREAVALEESGHGIVGDELGLKARDLFITKFGSGQYNDEDTTLGTLIVPSDLDASVKRIVALYTAGHVAQRIKFGRVICQSPSDQEVIRKYLLLVSSPDELRAEAEKFAEATLRARWAEVERVAVQLQLYGKLDAKRFYELIESRVAPAIPWAERRAALDARLGRAAVDRWLVEQGYTSLVTTQVRRATMPLMLRSATMNAANNSEVELVWTTGASVRRTSYDGPYDEVLETGEGNVRLGRLNAGAPLLNSHDSTDLSRVLGSVVPGSAKMVNGQGVARIKLSARAEVAGLVQDILAGVIRGVSVGYKYHKVEVDKRGDVPAWRVTDWEPMEISAVAIGADGGSQFRGDAQFECEVRG